jgi:integrase/recombinase XerD
MRLHVLARSSPRASRIAAHESPRTTKLYDRTGDEITLDEVERITI